MTCKDIEQDLALATLDCLDASRLLEIRQHCRDCPEWAAELQEFRRIASAHSRVAAELDAFPLRYNPPAAGGSPGVKNPGAADSIWRWLLPIGAIAAATLAFVMLDQPVGLPIAQKGPRPVTRPLLP